MSRKLTSYTILVAILVALIVPSGSTQARQRVTITWFIGLGTGTGLEQIETQNAVADAFNESQDQINLLLHFAASNAVAPDVFATLIASGEAPDIVGPVGFAGSNAFAGQWLDLQPLIESTGYSLEEIPANLVESYRTLGEGLTGLPFLVFPGVLYYNVALFDEVGLNYPPAVAGDPYVMPDGTEVPWDYDTVVGIGKILTVDADGNDATMEEFDPDNIIQYGFIHQWDTIRSDFHTFGAAYVVGDDGVVNFPESWRAEAQWLWDSIWTWHISPTAGVRGSELLTPSAFASGRVAMARSMAWYTCCLAEMEANWDLAVQPAYQGTIYAPIDLDTFRIHKDTKYPEEAFTVLTYLLGEAELDLATVYGGFPARPELQEAWIEAESAQYPSVTHWEVVPNSIVLAPNPHHEEWYPNFAKGQYQFEQFRSLIVTDSGGDIDVNAEFDRLQADLQAIIDEVK